MTTTRNIKSLTDQEYKYGFVTEIESESAPPGLNEDIIRLISAKKTRAGIRSGMAAIDVQTIVFRRSKNPPPAPPGRG